MNIAILSLIAIRKRIKMSWKYNSSKEKLIIPTYGRNVQQLVEHAKTIEDDEYRQKFAERVVKMIIQMHPDTKNVEDYENKIWSHVFKIANYDLKVTPPCEIVNSLEQKKPERVPYPQSNHRHRHYGRNVHNMIAKAIDMEDLEKKKAFVEVIGSYMKMAYKTWNRESVNDDIIRLDLKNMSKGALEIEEGVSLDGFQMATKKRTYSNSRSSHRGSNSRNYRNNKSNQYKRRKK